MVPPVMAHVLEADAGEVHTLEKTSVTLEVAGEPLRKVFDEIERQTSFLFLTSSEKVNAYPKVDLARGTYTVKDALDRVLKKTRLRYQQKNNYIVIFHAAENRGRRIGTNDMGLVYADDLSLPAHRVFTAEDVKRVVLGFLYMPVRTYRSVRDAC
jgi:hypothetical protein